MIYPHFLTIESLFMKASILLGTIFKMKDHSINERLMKTIQTKKRHEMYSSEFVKVDSGIYKNNTFYLQLNYEPLVNAFVLKKWKE